MSREKRIVMTEHAKHRVEQRFKPGEFRLPVINLQAIAKRHAVGEVYRTRQGLRTVFVCEHRESVIVIVTVFRG